MSARRLIAVRACLRGSGWVLLAIVATFLSAAAAEAVPNFARKYDLVCTACHTRTPRLNDFGRRFQENGYQVPGTEDGGSPAKTHLGTGRHRISLDAVSNFLSARLRGEVQKSSFRAPTEATDQVDFVFPSVVNLFIAGTATKNISFFMEAEYAPAEGHGAAVRFERVVLSFSNLGPKHQALSFKIGEFDPSAYFSFPTHRQQMNVVFPDAESEEFPPVIGRIPILPFAFSAKMYGLTRGPSVSGDEGFAILPFEPLLFNAPSAAGAAVYGRPVGENIFYQVGVVQGETAEDEARTRYDVHAMLRYDLPIRRYFSAQVSGFWYRAPKAARPALAPQGQLVFATEAVDWTRYGFGARVQYKFLDIYGAAIWDSIDDPVFGNPVLDRSQWETSAFGASLEVDWLVSEPWLIAARYDHMSPGGLSQLPPLLQQGDPKINQTASLFGIIGKFYPVPNIGLYARGHVNLNGSVRLPNALGGEENPARNLGSFFALGVDMAF